MPLQNRLKEYRTKKKINQSETGRLVGVSRQTISMMIVSQQKLVDLLKNSTRRNVEVSTI